MADEMEKDAIETATFAINEFLTEKDMANHIKKEFDKKYRSAALGGCHSATCHSSRAAAPAPVVGAAADRRARVHAPRPQPHMARHHRHQLRLARGPRDQALHLLLLGSEGHLDLQVGLKPSLGRCPQAAGTHASAAMQTACAPCRSPRPRPRVVSRAAAASWYSGAAAGAGRCAARAARQDFPDVLKASPFSTCADLV